MSIKLLDKLLTSKSSKTVGLVVEPDKLVRVLTNKQDSFDYREFQKSRTHNIFNTGKSILVEDNNSNSCVVEFNNEKDCLVWWNKILTTLPILEITKNKDYKLA